MEKLSSIIGNEDYEDLGNHSTEAMGETGLFMLMAKGLMEWSLHHEMALGRVREKAKLAEEELFELRNWKVVTE